MVLLLWPYFEPSLAPVEPCSLWDEKCVHTHTSLSGCSLTSKPKRSPQLLLTENCYLGKNTSKTRLYRLFVFDLLKKLIGLKLVSMHAKPMSHRWNVQTRITCPSSIQNGDKTSPKLIWIFTTSIVKFSKLRGDDACHQNSFPAKNHKVQTPIQNILPAWISMKTWQNIEVTKPLVMKCFRLLRSDERISSNFPKAPVTGKPGHHQIIDDEISHLLHLDEQMLSKCLLQAKPL